MWTNKNTKQDEDRKLQTTENETGSTVVGTERATVGRLSCAFTCTVGCPFGFYYIFQVFWEIR